MLKKISIFLVIIALIICIMPAKTSASVFDPIMNPDGYDPGKIETPEKVQEVSDTILGVIYYIGVFISVGGLMFMGIKYMMGSIEEKAQYKETLVPFMIGAILLFAGINILKLIYDLIKSGGLIS